MAQPVEKPKKPKAAPSHIPYKEREYFSENFALLLKAAVPVGEAVESLQANAHSRSFKKALQGLQSDINAGYGLADALERSGIVGEQTLALIRLGEASGHLVENMQLAAQQEAKRHMFRAKVRSALIYPSFVVTITLIVGLGVAWFLLPRLATTFSQLHVQLPPISRAMIAFGGFLQQHGLIAVPAFIILLLLLIYILFAAPKTKMIGRTLLFHMPGVGRLIKETEIAQFGYLLGTLMNAGLTVTQALGLLASATSTPNYKKLYEHLSASLDNGYTFRDSLKQYKGSQTVLPAAVQQMVVAGERSGSLPDVLLLTGRTYEQKADVTTQNLETIIEPVLLVLVAAGVLVVAVAVIVPIYSLVGGLSQ